MSVYLDGTSVLLDGSGNVATDAACCCGAATGACCHTDGSCSITTSDGCDGIYQGDGTVCADVNCDLCFSCSNYFLAFDGSGRKFLTYHGEMTGSHHRNDFRGVTCNVDYSGSSTVDMYYDMSCNLVETESCNSSRTNSCDSSDNCTLGTLECFCNSGSPPSCDHFCISFFAWECGTCSGGGCGSDNTVTTATTRTRTVEFCQHCTDGGGHPCDVSGSYVLTETLSDECF